MSFKVGDKVRLTGAGWRGQMKAPGKGDIVTLKDDISFNAYGTTWYVFGDPKDPWGAELVNDASDALDTLEAADIKAEHIARLEQIVRDVKDRVWNRWRSAKHPDYTVEEENHQTDIELKVRREGTAGFKSVDKAERTKPVGFTPEEWKVVREYRGDYDLPTEPGLYVPANNKDVLHATYVYALPETGGRWIQYKGHGAITWDEALEGVIHAHTNLGGLVRLGVVE